MTDKSNAVDGTAVKELLNNRRSAPDDEFVFGAERVTLELEGNGNGPFRAKKRDFEWVIDEPNERGGQDTGANPLAYLLSGAASCLLSHYMLLIIGEEISISDLRLNARASYNRVLEGGAFRTVDYDIKLNSEESHEVLRDLAERAEVMCYAHNTLVNAGVSLRTKLFVNGELVATLDKGPERETGA